MATRHDTTRRTVLFGAASLLAVPAASRAQARSVNVGVVLPLSGANAQFGVNSRNGIELVADEINAAGGIKALGGARVNLVVADITSTPTTAATVAQRLIAQNGTGLSPSWAPSPPCSASRSPRSRSGATCRC